jgi:PAS domain S-box-containing protein
MSKSTLGAKPLNTWPSASPQLNLDGRLLSANEHMRELIALPKRDLLEKSINDLFFSEGSWSECRAGLDQLIAGEIPHYSTSMWAVRTDGQRVWMDIVFSLVRDSVCSRPFPAKMARNSSW